MAHRHPQLNRAVAARGFSSQILKKPVRFSQAPRLLKVRGSVPALSHQEVLTVVRDCSNRALHSLFWRSAENRRAKIVRRLAEIGNQLSNLEELGQASDDRDAPSASLRTQRETLIARLSLHSAILAAQPI